MTTERNETIGRLRCIVVDSGPAPEIAVVICHGYGASLRDLAPLADPWIRLLGAEAGRFRFVFPDAPESLDAMGMPGGRAWWPINMMQLTELVQASKFDQLHDKRPPGIDQARDLLAETINLVLDQLSQASGSSPRFAIGGFSQGAMVTMETSLSDAIPKPDALFQFSGTLVCQSQWKEAMSQRLAGTKVYQSHGQIDPILPMSSAEALRDLMNSRQVDVQFHSFYGPHTIDGDSLDHTAAILRRLTEAD